MARISIGKTFHVLIIRLKKTRKIIQSCIYLRTRKSKASPRGEINSVKSSIGTENFWIKQLCKNNKSKLSRRNDNNNPGNLIKINKLLVPCQIQSATKLFGHENWFWWVHYNEVAPGESPQQLHTYKKTRKRRDKYLVVCCLLQVDVVLTY
jgi:hypothetical protein